MPSWPLTECPVAYCDNGAVVVNDNTAYKLTSTGDVQVMTFGQDGVQVSVGPREGRCRAELVMRREEFFALLKAGQALAERLKGGSN